MNLFYGLMREVVDGLTRETNHIRLKAMYSMGFLTFRCTSKCRTCTIWKRAESSKNYELDLKGWRTVIDRMYDYGIRAFEVFGGDALLRDDVVFDLIAHCHKKGMSTYFPTNSIMCDRQTVRRLVDAGLGTIYISLDDLGPENDEIRGVQGSFRRVQETHEYFVEERGNRPFPSIVVCTTLSKLNFRSFPRLLNFIDRYPVNAIYPRPLGEFKQENVKASAINGLEPEPYFATSDGDSHLLSDHDVEELKKIFAMVKKRRCGTYVNLRGYYLSSDHAYTRGEYPVRQCHVASLLVTINPNGDVVPCPFFRSYVIGNLIKQDLEQIWGSAEHRTFIKLQREGKLPICRNCNMRIDYPSMLEQFSYYAERALEKCGAKPL